MTCSHVSRLPTCREVGVLRYVSLQGAPHERHDGIARDVSTDNGRDRTPIPQYLSKKWC